MLFVLTALALVVLGPTSLPLARAVSPAPDGAYPGANTAECEDALFSLTTGRDNTAIGFHALFRDTTGSQNTANGFQALYTAAAIRPMALMRSLATPPALPTLRPVLSRWATI